MALVLSTNLKSETAGGNLKDIPWGTPYEKLTKADQKYARENNLLMQVPDLMPTLEEELDQIDSALQDDEDLVPIDQAEDSEAE